MSEYHKVVDKPGYHKEEHRDRREEGEGGFLSGLLGKDEPKREHHTMSTGGAATTTGGVATNPVSGEQHYHSTETGAKIDQAWQDMKTKVPGTKEHKATDPKVV